ncbi:prefoldin subunit domain containing protein [Nitzschia inconspicua]|uniref:Prefoldin subunit domain containing protein n=1 Tax=Nitzschia inconspicua TaxID=303405 RepID=A0A9K3PB38_9STRA|nr:prefoldin subunit domain containing protein [Nitzschia inconspicua]KAG7367805.1 prefoldin subunit domain containing protein [Nitzschia inconspicua]
MMNDDQDSVFNKDLLQQQLSNYAGLVENVLKPQLLIAEQAANRIRQEIRDYQELGQLLQQLNMTDTTATSTTTTMVDLGYQTIFCQASKSSGRMLLVHVGMGFHVELTISEAQAFVLKRIQYLQNTRLHPQQRNMDEIQEHITSATDLLLQLQQEITRNSQRNDNTTNGLGQ